MSWRKQARQLGKKNWEWLIFWTINIVLEIMQLAKLVNEYCPKCITSPVLYTCGVRECWLRWLCPFWCIGIGSTDKIEIHVCGADAGTIRIESRHSNNSTWEHVLPACAGLSNSAMTLWVSQMRQWVKTDSQEPEIICIYNIIYIYTVAIYMYNAFIDVFLTNQTSAILEMRMLMTAAGWMAEFGTSGGPQPPWPISGLHSHINSVDRDPTVDASM